MLIKWLTCLRTVGKEQPVSLAIMLFGYFELMAIAYGILRLIVAIIFLLAPWWRQIVVSFLFSAVGLLMPMSRILMLNFLGSFCMGIGRAVLLVTCWHLDTFWVFVQLRYYLPRAEHKVHDGKGATVGTQMHRVRYSASYDKDRAGFALVISPCEDEGWYRKAIDARGLFFFSFALHGVNLRETRLEDLPKVEGEEKAVLYIHGGGFVAANASVLVQSVTPLVRAGFTVYAIDYPLAPAHIFPIPVVSVLQALQWLRVKRGVKRCHVYGDSAGAALASVAAALVCNPKVMIPFLEEARQVGHTVDLDLDGPGEKFSAVDRLLLVYGILDEESWQVVKPKASRETGSGMPSSAVPRAFMDSFIGTDKMLNLLPSVWAIESFLAFLGIKFCFECYHSSSQRARLPFFGDRCTFADFVECCDQLPKTLLLCGDKDLLVLSSRRLYVMLRTRGFQCDIFSYPARHAFVGLPASWMNPDLQQAASKADRDIVDFLRGSEGT
ncbi:unnamed protein product [Polarella glacialis]|uniref:Alpha/beta hydrolase fold-3 domain-containing protein n=1 Tax=Polarella glacialis TaxID=89957 RepID=A0A813EZF7_POLGL|nr:unnamed protein product [Polarella glacialis]